MAIHGRKWQWLGEHNKTKTCRPQAEISTAASGVSQASSAAPSVRTEQDAVDIEVETMEQEVLNHILQQPGVALEGDVLTFQQEQQVAATLPDTVPAELPEVQASQHAEPAGADKGAEDTGSQGPVSHPPAVAVTTVPAGEQAPPAQNPEVPPPSPPIPSPQQPAVTPCTAVEQRTSEVLQPPQPAVVSPLSAPIPSPQQPAVTPCTAVEQHTSEVSQPQQPAVVPPPSAPLPSLQQPAVTPCPAPAVEQHTSVVPRPQQPAVVIPQPPAQPPAEKPPAPGTGAEPQLPAGSEPLAVMPQVTPPQQQPEAPKAPAHGAASSQDQVTPPLHQWQPARQHYL